jgi:protein-S-isoprenylcysteine O-methyltransferase Ste14
MEVLGVRKILRRIKGETAKPPELVLKGPYRYCRHPVYVATIAALWIGPIMTYGRLEFAILGTVYIFIGTWLEEMTARAEIGDAYKAYQVHVPMWIPRFTPWKDR